MAVTCVVSDTVANVASEIETLFDAPTLSAPHGTQAQCKLCFPRLAFIQMEIVFPYHECPKATDLLTRRAESNRWKWCSLSTSLESALDWLEFFV